MSDLVSIVMPSYNTSKYIENSIKSVLNQTYQNWELLIIDDCSKDNTEDVVTPYLSDFRIKFLKNPHNIGAALSRNRAIREAKGKYIAFLDSDDTWDKEKLSKQISFMKRNQYTFSFTDYVTSVNDVVLPYVYTGPNVVGKVQMMNYCYIFTSTVMYDRENIGLIQIPDLKKNNDYAMWLKIVKKTPCYRLKENLACYNRHENSISSGRKYKLIKYHYFLFLSLGYSKAASMLLTVNNLFWGVLKQVIYRKKVK